MGRPKGAAKLTPEIFKTIIDSRKNLLPLNKCAWLVGIHPNTLDQWIKRGRKGDPDKNIRRFYEAIKQAESRGIQERLATIQKASKRNWQAAAWMLERLFPDLFGRSSMNAPVSSSITVMIPMIVQRLREIIPDPDARLKIADQLSAISDKIPDQLVDSKMNRDEEEADRPIDEQA